MKKIYVLEHFDFNETQWKRLQTLGEVKYYEKANGQEIDDAIENADAILIDWLNPDPILEKMKKTMLNLYSVLQVSPLLVWVKTQAWLLLN